MLQGSTKKIGKLELSQAFVSPYPETALSLQEQYIHPKPHNPLSRFAWVGGKVNKFATFLCNLQTVKGYRERGAKMGGGGE